MSKPDFSTKDLADRWNLTQATIRSWRMRDQGPPYFRLGPPPRGRIRYRHSEIVKYEKASGIRPANGEDGS